MTLNAELKITHIIPFYQPGLGYEENQLGFAQARQNCDVTIICSTETPPEWQKSAISQGTALHHELEPSVENGVLIWRLSSYFHARYQPLIVLKGLRRALGNVQPDIVHLHSPVGLMTIQTLVAARMLKIPVVVDSHLGYSNLAPYTLKKRIYYRVFRYMVLPMFRKVIRRYLPVTPGAEMVLRTELGVHQDLITHATLGTDADRFKFVADGGNRIRREFGIPESTRLGLFVGRVTPDKDIDVLLHAAEPQLASGKLFLLIAGPGDPNYIKQLQATLSPRACENVAFVGFVQHDDLPEYYSAADIGVWPGVAAISIIDAIACGLPLVISQEDTTRHLIADGNGLSFARGNVDELRRSLSRMIDDEDLRQKLATKSREVVHRKFSWDSIASRTIEIYRSVLVNTPDTLPPLWSHEPS